MRQATIKRTLPFDTMSINTHGMPSRVRAIAEIGRLLADAEVAEQDKRNALDLLAQDHADLDEVEANAALWALAQMGPHDAARQALLACAPQLLHSSENAQQFLNAYAAIVGPRQVPQAHAAFSRVAALALHDCELAARLGLFR